MLARRRLVAMLLTLLIEALLVWGILNIQRTPSGRRTNSVTKTFQISEASDKPAPKRQSEKALPARAATKQPITPPVVVEKPPAPGFVPMSKADFAASDISKLGSAPKGNDDGAGEAVAEGTGQGPGGATLYNAKWRREPSDRELAPYLTKQSRSGWAMIICQTIEHYRVENCRTRGESPQGSGLAQAMRKASWQFEVVPPRVNGKALIGAWVNIRFDMTAVRGDPPPLGSAQDPPEAQN